METIVALPIDMFYNTGISTYIWILSNKKNKERKGKVLLVNGVDLYGKMQKSPGSKSKLMDDDSRTITKAFGNFEEIAPYPLDKPEETKSNRGRQSANTKKAAPRTFSAKVFQTHQFGYRRLTIERPLRESYQFSNDRLATLRFDSKKLAPAMEWIYETYGETWSDAPDCPALWPVQ